MKAFWTYTLARFAVLAVTYGVVAFTFYVWPEFFVPSLLTNLAALGIAAIIAAIISMFLLAGLRERFADELAARTQRMNERIEKSRSAEDVD